MAAALAAGAMLAADCGAVYLSAEGRGQALILPYYSTRATAPGRLNTYLSVVNHEDRPKALRVRFREGRNGREALGFNLYLAAHDVWTGALVPRSADPASEAVLLSIDTSCTHPELATLEGNPGLAFQPLSRAGYTGALADGLGESLDRTQEGYVEVIEMATLRGAAAAAVTPDGSGRANCAAIRSAGVAAADLEPPTGGLSGTLSVIDVENGMDFTVNAEALAALTTQPFYREPGDDRVDFDSPEITPRSLITSGGIEHHLHWSSGLEAVSSVLMRARVYNEHVRDAVTASGTEWILTLPTRRLHAGARPFSAAGPGACEEARGLFLDREARSTAVGDPPGPPAKLCAASTVAAIAASAAAGPALNSMNPHRDAPLAPAGLASGWLDLGFTGPGAADLGLVSLPTSTSRELATGSVSSGSRIVHGLPVTGFMVRNFRNGTLGCNVGHCQGNYGGAFPHRYRIDIRPAF